MKPYWQNSAGSIFHGDVLEVLRDLPDESVNCCVTSPPYWGLRDYGVEGQIGLEPTPDEFVARMVEVFGEVRRVLRPDGTLWLNLGDSYIGGGRAGKDGQAYGGMEAQNRCNAKVKWGAPTGKIEGLKPKDLCGIPWRVAFALQSDGWYLRQDIIWKKPNPMPESVRDRCTKAHEYLFLLSKSQRYYYDCDAVREPLRPKTFTTFGTHHRAQGNDALGCVKSDNWGRTVGERKPMLTDSGEIAGANKRSVWTVATKPFKGAHFATFPPALIHPCILAGCPEGGTVLDPFFGSGTTGVVAHQLDRKFIGIELNKSYLDDIAVPRMEAETAQLKLFT